MIRLLASTVFGLAILAGTASAEYAAVQDRNEFMRIVGGRTLVLTRPGIVRPVTIQVERNGSLTGEARGYELNGDWQWTDGQFCRQIDWSGFKVRFSCQAISKDGDTLKFVSDRGFFRTAYFELQ
jgi:hypothetical protein